MKIVQLTGHNTAEIISLAVNALQNGEIIIYPTETCYGVGVDATNEAAVDRLLKYKERPAGKAISIAVTGKEMASKYVEINETAENLYRNFLPGPITVISQSKYRIAEGIAAEDGSLGIRIPDYPFTLELIKQFGKPITATSANLSGRKTPYTIDDILNNASEKNKKLIGLIIDAGELPHNPPSTVIDTRLNSNEILRKGDISLQDPQNQRSKDSQLKQRTVTTKSPEETQKVGTELMKELLPTLKNTAVVFALQGDLGAGKTQFAKGVAKALGITQTIASPTFTIVNEYEIKLKMKKEKGKTTSKNSQGENTRYFYHIDTWRLHEGKELSDLGFDDMVKPGNVVVIEWPEKVNSLLKSLEELNVKILRLSITDFAEGQRLVALFQ